MRASCGPSLSVDFPTCLSRIGRAFAERLASEGMRKFVPAVIAVWTCARWVVLAIEIIAVKVQRVPARVLRRLSSATQHLVALSVCVWQPDKHEF